jgi:hypothetical protein
MQISGTFDPAMADAFRSLVQRDSQWEQVTRAVAEPARDPARMRTALATACDLSLVFGEETCVHGIEATVNAATSFPVFPMPRFWPMPRQLDRWRCREGAWRLGQQKR